MKKSGWLVLITALIMLALVPGVVSAQQSEEVELTGGYVISVPESWAKSENANVYVLKNGNLTIYVMTPDVVADNFDPATNVTDMLIMAYEQMSARTIDQRDVATQTVDDYAVATTEFELNDGDQLGISVVIEVAPGQYGLMEFHAPADEYDTTLDEALDIMLSLRIKSTGRPLQNEDEAPPAASEDGISSASVEPCAVRARRAQVQLHVGPGENRGIYREMEQGPYIPVLGKATASDGSLWWKLDTPTGDANELWVADADVEQRGGCQYVMDANVPPIIPALPRPSESGGGQSSGGGETPAIPSGFVGCPIVNLSTFTIKGTLSGPAGPYTFEIPAGSYVVLAVKAGTYTADYFCDGCGNLGARDFWLCDGYTYFTIDVR